VGSGKWEVGSGKWEVGSGKWDVGRGTWDVGRGTWDVRWGPVFRRPGAGRGCPGQTQLRGRLFAPTPPASPVPRLGERRGGEGERERGGGEQPTTPAQGQPRGGGMVAGMARGDLHTEKAPQAAGTHTPRTHMHTHAHPYAPATSYDAGPGAPLRSTSPARGLLPMENAGARLLRESDAASGSYCGPGVASPVRRSRASRPNTTVGALCTQTHTHTARRPTAPTHRCAHTYTHACMQPLTHKQTRIEQNKQSHACNHSHSHIHDSRSKDTRPHQPCARHPRTCRAHTRTQLGVYHTFFELPMPMS
jgi:hypothetical protein